MLRTISWPIRPVRTRSQIARSSRDPARNPASSASRPPRQPGRPLVRRPCTGTGPLLSFVCAPSPAPERTAPATGRPAIKLAQNAPSDAPSRTAQTHALAPNVLCGTAARRRAAETPQTRSCLQRPSIGGENRSKALCSSSSFLPALRHARTRCLPEPVLL
ncbi:hypothetical protein C8T65DRAFT_632880, partial [Cerioporus squamosus]